MTKKQAKILLPPMQHFASGGDLWVYKDGNWYKQKEMILNAANKLRANIIEDKHFETRKHFALGGEVEYFDFEARKWVECAHVFLWNDKDTYRPKEDEDDGISVHDWWADDED